MTFIDWAILAAYGVLVIGIGLRSGAGHQSSNDLFLGGRSLPWWAVLCSLFATELSAATYIGVPEEAFKNRNWFYLQFAFGALAAKVVLMKTFVPLYYKLGVTTVYGFMDSRFGPTARRTTALFFIVGRILASGVRLYIGAIALDVALGIGVPWTIGICALFAAIYSLIGGIRAVVWTDTVQGALLIVGALSAIAILIAEVPGGVGTILEPIGWERVFSFPSPLPAADSDESILARIGAAYFASDSSFLTAFIGGFFLILATHSTDHNMVQRLLTTSRAAGSARALLGSALLNFPVTIAFLFIGCGLASFYADAPGLDPKNIFAKFITEEMPTGLRGLVFTGLVAAAMSSVDSTICAIGTTWVVEVAPREGEGDAQLVRRMRMMTAVTTLLLIASAIGFAHYDDWARSLGTRAPALSLVRLALSAMTIIYGGLFGAFWAGFLTRRGGSASVIAALIVGSLLGLFFFLQPILYETTYLSWPWWIPISGSVAFAIVCLRAPRVGEATARRKEPAIE